MVHFVDLSPYYGSHLQIVGHYSLGKKLEHFRYSGNFLIASDYSEQCDIAIRQVKIRGSFNQVACKLLANNKKIYLQSFIISSSVKFSNSQLRSTLSESKFSSSCTISWVWLFTLFFCDIHFEFSTKCKTVTADPSYWDGKKLTGIMFFFLCMLTGRYVSFLKAFINATWSFVHSTYIQWRLIQPNHVRLSHFCG